MGVNYSVVFLVLVSLGLAGCASAEISAEKDELEAAQTEFPSLTLPKIDLGTVPPRAKGSPTEIYTRIARGAVTCWFGAHGALKDTHVYSAIAKPPSKGGQARILIHKKDPTLKDKRGARAFAIDIIPDGKTAKLEMQNALMGEPQGSEMAKDVRRWAGGLEGCVAEPVMAGWGANDKPKSKATSKAKSKPKPKRQPVKTKAQ